MNFDPKRADRRWVVRMWLYVIAVNLAFFGAIAFILWRIFA